MHRAGHCGINVLRLEDICGSLPGWLLEAAR